MTKSFGHDPSARSEVEQGGERENCVVKTRSFKTMNHAALPKHSEHQNNINTSECAKLVFSSANRHPANFASVDFCFERMKGLIVNDNCLWWHNVCSSCSKPCRATCLSFGPNKKWIVATNGRKYASLELDVLRSIWNEAEACRTLAMADMLSVKKLRMFVPIPHSFIHSCGLNTIVSWPRFPKWPVVEFTRLDGGEHYMEIWLGRGVEMALWVFLLAFLLIIEHWPHPYRR